MEPSARGAPRGGAPLQTGASGGRFPARRTEAPLAENRFQSSLGRGQPRKASLRAKHSGLQGGSLIRRSHEQIGEPKDPTAQEISKSRPNCFDRFDWFDCGSCRQCSPLSYHRQHLSWKARQLALPPSPATAGCSWWHGKRRTGPRALPRGAFTRIRPESQKLFSHKRTQGTQKNGAFGRVPLFAFSAFFCGHEFRHLQFDSVGFKQSRHDLPLAPSLAASVKIHSDRFDSIEKDQPPAIAFKLSGLRFEPPASMPFALRGFGLFAMGKCIPVSPFARFTRPRHNPPPRLLSTRRLY